MVKLTTGQILKVHNLLNNAKVTKMTNDDRVEMVKIMRVLKPIQSEYMDFQKEISSKLRPDGFEPIEQKVVAQVPLSPQERLIFTKFDAELQKPLEEESKKENNLDFSPLSKEAIARLIESNDFSMAEIMTLYDTISQ